MTNEELEKEVTTLRAEVADLKAKLFRFVDIHDKNMHVLNTNDLILQRNIRRIANSGSWTDWLPL